MYGDENNSKQLSSPYENVQIFGILGNELCLTLLLGDCNTKERGDLSISLLKTLTENRL
jgi:hypothetical protein